MERGREGELDTVLGRVSWILHSCLTVFTKKAHSLQFVFFVFVIALRVICVIIRFVLFLCVCACFEAGNGAGNCAVHGKETASKPRVLPTAAEIRTKYSTALVCPFEWTVI